MPSLGMIDLPNVLGAGLTSLNQGPIGKITNRYNSFMGKVADRLSPSRRLLGEPYARKNALHTRLQRPDPIHAFDWIGVVLSPNVSTATQLPWHYIDGITVPDLTLETQEQPWNGSTRKTAGRATVGGAELKLYTAVDGLSTSYAHQWVRTAYRVDGFFSLPSSYQRDVAVFLLDPERNIVVDFRLINCTPTGVNSISLGGESGFVETTISLSVDDVQVNYDSEFTAAKDAIEGIFQSGVGSLMSYARSIIS